MLVKLAAAHAVPHQTVTDRYKQDGISSVTSSV
jgi:hypothetical protein